MKAPLLDNLDRKTKICLRALQFKQRSGVKFVSRIPTVCEVLIYICTRKHIQQLVLIDMPYDTILIFVVLFIFILQYRYACVRTYHVFMYRIYSINIHHTVCFISYHNFSRMITFYLVFFLIYYFSLSFLFLVFFSLFLFYLSFHQYQKKSI